MLMPSLCIKEWGNGDRGIGGEGKVKGGWETTTQLHSNKGLIS